MATTAKKTTAKPAAKKTTAAKPTAKKTAAAAKPAAKKTTTAKPAAKPVAKKTTAAAKPAAKSTDVSVSGNKKIASLCKEFNKKFPYLCLSIFYPKASTLSVFSSELQRYRIPGDKTIASVRRENSSGDISISGNKKIKTLEKEFSSILGLYCQVGYTTVSVGRVYSNYTDDMTLAKLNAICEKGNEKKGEWW